MLGTPQARWFCRSHTRRISSSSRNSNSGVWGDSGSHHNFDIFVFEAHNLPPALHLLIRSERTFRPLYSHSFRYGEFHDLTERIEYANFLSVDSHVTDHTRLTHQKCYCENLSTAANSERQPSPPPWQITPLSSLIHRIYGLQEPPQLSDMLRRPQ
jgi:hypothetical protein